ncbi:M50 family metallopeptidase [Paenibacillus sp. JX-17]|uniref:M50 family metallopeptidase n=1 Tax=Paenibacillus lacisoli TaxID=3064525 RepID=A0ABT9CCY2_9BACL|nr:M50 family metallopeptidase [Paenibacillus sp. JX-17]MDO7907125.1 M50 family metallopeptidase [Paenibacillus sp. JX-17]
MNKWLKTILFLVGSAVLTRFIPFSYLFRTVDTMIHEAGHALVTLLTSGHVQRIVLNADHSGVTYSTMYSTWSSVLTGLAGYMLASLCALLLFYWMSRKRYERGLWLLLGIAALLLMFYVREGYGLFWLIGFIILTALIQYGPAWLRVFYYGLLAFLTLEESVVGPVYLLTRSLSAPGSAGDAANLARMTGIPAIFWAAVFLIFALLCARWALGMFLRRRRR